MISRYSGLFYSKFDSQFHEIPL